MAAVRWGRPRWGAVRYAGAAVTVFAFAQLESFKVGGDLRTGSWRAGELRRESYAAGALRAQIVKAGALRVESYGETDDNTVEED